MLSERPTYVADRLGTHPLDTPIRAVMTPGVVTLPEDASVRQAFGALVSHRVHAVLVVAHRQAEPLGWVTSRGLTPFLEREDDLIAVRDAITEPPRVVEPYATVRDALTLLSEPGVTHLVVSAPDARVPEGVVTELDLAAVAVR